MILALLLAFVLAAASPALGATWYVDDSVPESGTGVSWQTAFKTIQGGIDASAHGDTVIVAEGTYVENVHFRDKNITLTSTDPLNPDVVANTVIDGNNVGSVVAFSGTEDEACVLSGFTIRNGRAESGGGICGGTNKAHCRAEIRNSIIMANHATGWIVGGGGLCYCDGVIRNNTISANSAEGDGGGLRGCNGTIRNNVISGNVAYAGGGLDYCGGAIESNTIAGNWAEWDGGGLSMCAGMVRNCIVWENESRMQVIGCQPVYCCIWRWKEGGEGNISDCPYFVDAANGDYHLKPWSPCIDAGDPSCDFSQEPEPNGGRIDIGAYGNTPEANSKSPDADGDGLPDQWEIHSFGELGQKGDGDADGDALPNMQEYRRGSDPKAPPAVLHVDGAVPSSGDGSCWETALKTIQQGIDAASDGDTVTVAKGRYVENLHFHGKNIIVRSIDPLDAEIVGNTVIDGDLAGSVVTFTGSEEKTCVLTGFTLTQGAVQYAGGGINGHRTYATIRHNLITQNSAGEGGGICQCQGTIEGNTVTENSARGGGGLCSCTGVVQQNTVSYNTATGSNSYGGGLSACGGLIQENVISWNSAIGSESMGGGLARCWGSVRNNLIVGNSAEGRGGGMADCNGAIENNTICENSAPYGGGVDSCGKVIRNCVLWGNTATQSGSQIYDGSIPFFCCIQNWTGVGVGNITSHPLFRDPERKDYHLSQGSPCIDAGENFHWFVWPQHDLDGNCRLFGERIDIGCYEFGASSDLDGDLLSDFDELSHGTDPALEDSDGDGLRDVLEIARGADRLSPTLPGVFHVPSDIPTIQGALLVSVNGDEIIVSPGVYYENLVFCGTSVVLRSTDPSDPGVVANTIIDGSKAGPVITLSGTEDETSLLSGFTIQNGSGHYGGGICGGTNDQRTRAPIRNNVIRANSAESCGGGIAFCDGGIRDNVVADNFATYDGGGLYGCGGPIENNTIERNRVVGEVYYDWVWGDYEKFWMAIGCRPGTGGGVAGCSGLIENNSISENCAGACDGWAYEGHVGYGGGLANSSGTIRNNRIVGNRACGELWTCVIPPYACSAEYWSMGGGLYECEGTIENNEIRGNGYDGLAACDGVIQNNFITGNSGNALYDCGGPIRNNEIAHNGTALFDCGGIIEGNLISENWAGLYSCDALIQNNVISNNHDSGLSYCGGTIRNNTISGNSAGAAYTDRSGGGLYECKGVIQDNIICANRADYSGGGLSRCDGVIEHNLIYGNSTAWQGGALSYCKAAIINNTIFANSASKGAGGLLNCTGDIVNCIIWGNRPRPQLQDSDIPSYSCVEGWAGGGEGNIRFDPYFVDEENGDFHLLSWSSCIDAGDPSSDFSNEPRDPLGGRIDMGAYGNTAEATPESPDTDQDGLPDDWELHWFGNLDGDGFADPDNDGVSNTTEYRYGSDPIVVPGGPVRNVTTGQRYKTIWMALLDSGEGDEIVVYPGTYYENVIMPGGNVVLRSSDPSDPAVVAATIVDAQGEGSAVTFSGIEDETCVLAGFTVRNGKARYGGGVCGGTAQSRTRATIRNNVITSNAVESGGAGGGLAFCDGLIHNNTVTENSASWGALYVCHGTIEGNSICRNSGGGVYDCDGAIRNNLIACNSGAGPGGGLSWCDGTICNNTFVGNLATGGGAPLCYCRGVILNCVIWGNLWDGRPDQIGQSATPAYCCIQYWTQGGMGNTANDPQFFDPDGPDNDPSTWADNDYHLLPYSPCIDAGKNESWMWSAVDLDGNPRLVQGFGSLTVDVGAYEYSIREFGVLSITEGTHGELELTWRSRPGDAYTVMSCFDLLSGDWKSLATIYAYGPATSWADPYAEKATQKFYRIEISQ